MLYIRIPSLVLEKNILKCLTIYGHGSHLVPWHGTIQTNCQYPFDRRPHVKSCENCSSGFGEEDIKNYTIVYMYIAQGAMTDKPQGAKCFTTLIIHCKFQPLVFSTF